jgi:hypothetical protein
MKPTLSGLKLGGLAVGLLAIAGLTTPALANGGDFFEELQLHWGGVKPDMGSPYFGFVRDSRGKFIQGATVTATIKPGGSSMSIQTNVLGHFTIAGFAKHINPDTVEVTCAKQGYKQANVTRRHYKDRPMAPVEVQCTLAPVTAAAPASRS